MPMKNQVPWYKHPLRIAALQCNYEADNFAVLDRWHAYDFNTEQLLHLIGQDYYALFEEQKHGAALARYLAKAHGLGMRVIVYMNTHLLPQTMSERDPEWAARLPDGRYRSAYDTYRLGCPNSPWADWIMGELARLARYDIDGVFSDGPSGACFCEHCARAFEAQFGRPLPRDAVPNSANAEVDAQSDARALREFDLATRVRFSQRFYSTLKSVRPAAICYQNLDVMDTPSAPFLPCNDVLGSEGGFMFYGPPKDGYLWKTSLRAKALEACARGRATIIFAAGDQKSWSRYLHAPGETRILHAASVANGASVWYGLHCPSDALSLPGGRAAGEINHFLAEHEHLYDGTTSLATVALLHSTATRTHYRTAREASDFYDARGTSTASGPGNAARSVEGFAAMLYRSQVPFDLVSDEDCAAADLLNALRRYRCVILPTTSCLCEAALEALRTFVRDGGLLIASLDSSLFNEHGQRRADFGLADVFGASLRPSFLRMRDFNYYEVLDHVHVVTAGSAVTLVAAPDFGLEVQPTSAAVLARFHTPLAGRYEPLTPLSSPAVLWNDYGRGHCLYLPGTFGEFYADYSTLEYQQMINAAIQSYAAPPVSLTHAPPSLEVTVRRKSDGSATLVHLINYTGGMTRPIQQALPLHDVQLVLGAQALTPSPRRIRALVAGQDLPIPTAPSQAIPLPVLHEYEVILIEHAASQSLPAA
jgi:hypothetical protein